MIAFLNMLNVKPEERRAVILFFMGALVVGNLVWLSMEPGLLVLRRNLAKHEQKIQELQAVPALHAELKAIVDDLNPEAGLVDGKDQANKVMDTLVGEGERIGITFKRNDGQRPSVSKSRPFIEHRRMVSFDTNWLKVVEFLMSIAKNEDSMIRVGNYAIRPTMDNQRLGVDMTFVASSPNPDYVPKKTRKKK